MAAPADLDNGEGDCRACATDQHGHGRVAEGIGRVPDLPVVGPDVATAPVAWYQVFPPESATPVTVAAAPVSSRVLIVATSRSPVVVAVGAVATDRRTQGRVCRAERLHHAGRGIQEGDVADCECGPHGEQRDRAEDPDHDPDHHAERGSAKQPPVRSAIASARGEQHRRCLRRCGSLATPRHTRKTPN